MDELFNFESPDQAANLQRDLSGRVACVDDEGFDPRFFGGMDAAYRGDTAFIAATVWDAKRREFVGKARAVDKVFVRYVSGFLGFREGPLLARIAKELVPEPDIFLVDGQGVAHPRRFGLACHVGLALDKPTVGVAKTPLYGKRETTKIVAPNGEVIGRIVSASNTRNLYVSVGHRISLDTASKIVHTCMVAGHPLPLREAHLDTIRMKGVHQI